jgi:hypothetical protein
MVRAVYRKGAIEPLDSIPPWWHEGQELTVESAEPDQSPEAIDQWVAEVRAATANISDEDHDALMAAVAEIEAESKQLARRDFERSE